MVLCGNGRRQLKDILSSVARLVSLDEIHGSGKKRGASLFDFSEMEVSKQDTISTEEIVLSQRLEC